MAVRSRRYGNWQTDMNWGVVRMKQLIFIVAMTLCVLLSFTSSAQSISSVIAQDSLNVQIRYHGFTEQQQRLFEKHITSLQQNISDTQIAASNTEVMFILKKIAAKQQMQMTMYHNENVILLFNNTATRAKNSRW